MMEQLERALSALFDFQRFAANRRLAELLRETEERTGGPCLLEDEALELYAAGDADLLREKGKDKLCLLYTSRCV